MQKYQDNLKSHNTSDARLTEALTRPGLYVVRFNNIHGAQTDVIKLGRTDITDTAKLRNRMNDYHGANAFSFRIIAFGLTRRRVFANSRSKAAHEVVSIVNEAENDMRAFVNREFKANLVDFPAQRKEFFYGPPALVDRIQTRMIKALKENYNVHEVLLFDENGISEHWHNDKLDRPWSEVAGKRKGVARPIVASARPGDAPEFRELSTTRAGSRQSLALLLQPPIRGGKFRAL